MEEHIQKWRLILGKDAVVPEASMELSAAAAAMDDVLEALYNTGASGGLGDSSPNVHRWLGDIRTYFPTAIVQIMQRDALERLNLKQMLLEPELLESLEADVHLVSTLLSLQEVLPQETRETARQVVRKVVVELQERLKSPLEVAVKGAVQRAFRNQRPKWAEVDWPRTIRANLKHYQPDLQAIIPELLIGYSKKGHALRRVILLVDQSGSMASSVVYASVFGAVLASIPSLKTHFIVFDTKVVNMTEQLQDPVDLLFGTQLGGGTDIGKALAYVQHLLECPQDTIVVLISDLFDGGESKQLYHRVAAIKASGAQLIVLLAVSDAGKPTYNSELAAHLATLDIPAFGCTPDKFPEVMAAAIQKHSLDQ
ncbi:MAG: VWA domain-containing protein, partial [Bacteroidota bacterium]